MAQAIAQVPTRSASRYLQQLCKHWSHKLAVDFTPERGTVTFPDAVAEMVAHPDRLEVTVRAGDAATVERMEGVVQRHLDRFAFREAPLAFDWQAG